MRRRLPPWPSFDTLEASLLLYPELDRHALNVMAAHLGVEPPSHRALQDASVTVDLFAALCRRAASLATPERALLQAAGWTPLTLLEELRMPPDEAPPPLVAADPPQTGTPAALGCEADGWRHEFGEAGRLSRRMPGFRVREGQSDFAEACAALLAEGGVGLFEPAPYGQESRLPASRRLRRRQPWRAGARQHQDEALHGSFAHARTAPG